MRRYSWARLMRARSGVPTRHAGLDTGDARRVVERRGTERGGEPAIRESRAGEPREDRAGVDAAARDYPALGALERAYVEALEHLVGESLAVDAAVTADREHRKDLHPRLVDAESDQERPEALVESAVLGKDLRGGDDRQHSSGVKTE